MSERRDVRKTLDLALRIGAVLLASGASAADTAETMEGVALASGLRNVIRVAS